MQFVTKAELDKSKYKFAETEYTTRYYGILRAHPAGTTVTVVKVEVQLNNSGNDGIVISDRYGLRLEMVPSYDLINWMHGHMKRYFFAELDFREDNKTVKLLVPLADQRMIQ